jgi:NADH:ubiquinone oxidoreductase subunit 4 (subunit M)
MLPLLIFFKLAAYFAVFRAAPRLLAVEPVSPNSFAVKWAVGRMVLGFLVGAPLFIVVGYAENAGLSFSAAYVAVLLPARILLWVFVCAALLQRNPQTESVSRSPWIACGVVASFTVDGLAILLGIENIRLFC